MGLVYKKEIEDGAILAVWEITEQEDELMEICSLPNDDLEELAVTKNKMRRRELLAVRALLNDVFKEKLYLGHHDNGRPYLVNRVTEISISHTNRYAAIIAHPEKSVGIDIESLDRDFSAVEKRALSRQEKENLPERNRNLSLAIHWSAKEAVFKRMSMSNIDFAGRIQISKFTPRDSGTLEALFKHPGNDKESVFELKYELFENHVIVWIVE